MLDPAIPYDLIMLTALARDVAALTPALAASRAQAILFMFNTFEATGRWHDAPGANRLVHGFPNMAAFFEDGNVAALARLTASILTALVCLFSRTAAVRKLGEFGPDEVRALIDAMTAAGPGRTAKLLAIRP